MTTPSLDVLSEELVLISIKLVRRLRGLDPTPALSPAESSALAVLIFAGEITMGELASYEGVKAPTMTRLVQNLEQRGVIKRIKDEKDARIFRLGVTATGRKLFTTGQKRRLQPLIKLLDSLEASDRTKLMAALPVLRKIAEVGEQERAIAKQ